MLNIYRGRGGRVFISSTFIALYSFIGCQAPPQTEVDTKRIILVVEVRVSAPGQELTGAEKAGSIIFYSNYSYRADVSNDLLKQRISSVFGRIIAEGRAYASDYRSGRPGLSAYRTGIPITDRNFIFALIETAEQRLNNSGQGARIHFSYKINKRE